MRCYALLLIAHQTAPRPTSSLGQQPRSPASQPPMSDPGAALLLNSRSASPPTAASYSSSSGGVTAADDSFDPGSGGSVRSIGSGGVSYESIGGGARTPGPGARGTQPRSRAGSVEFLYPPLMSSQRQSSLSGAVFNLTATILGGGILSLPFCFALCGLAVGTVLLVAIALASNFSIYILISCSRRVRHGASYEEVVSAAFGPKAGGAVVATLFALVYLVIVAYCILIRDLVSPLVELLVGSEQPFGSLGRFLIVLAVVSLMLPLCLKRSMAALSWLSVASIVPMGVLCYAVMIRGWQAVVAVHAASHAASPIGAADAASASSSLLLVSASDMTLKWVPASSNDVLYAIPILACAFMCHFNVLPLHGELIRPTRPRIKQMIQSVIGICSGLYLTVGVCGYLFARAATAGNILNNFAVSDPLAVACRAAMGFTCIAGFPMIVLPARNVLGKIIQSVGLLAWAGGVEGSSSAAAAAAAEEVAPLASRSNSTSAASVPFGLLSSASQSQEHDPLSPEVDSDSEVEEGEDAVVDAGAEGELYGSAARRNAAVAARAQARASNGLQQQHDEESGVASVHSGSSSSAVSYDSSSHAGAAPFFTEGSPLLSAGNGSSTSGGRSAVASAPPLSVSYTSSSASASAAADPSSSTAGGPSSEPVFSEYSLTVQTLSICLSALLISARVASVATLWNLVGSSACILLGYVVPSACYLRIRRAKPLGPRMGAAWGLLALGIVLLIVCTAESFRSLTAADASEAHEAAAAAATAAPGSSLVLETKL